MMNKAIFKSGLTSLILVVVAFQGWAQNNVRPTVPVPGGFEVNSYTGNLYYGRTDLKLPGRGLDISLLFSFNTSRIDKDRGMGRGWIFSYDMGYATDSLGIYIDREDGKRELYQKVNNAYRSPVGVFDSLSEYQAGKYSLKQKDGTRYFFDDSTHKKLTRLEDLNGNAITFNYANKLLNSITDASGMTVQLTWSGSRLTEVADNNCAPQRKISYDYDTTGNMVKVTDPMGNYIGYYYNRMGMLIGMTDGNGNNFSIVYNANMAVDKIVSCATTHMFSYAQAQFKTFVTESVNGQRVVTTYQYDTLGRVIDKKGNCCGYNVKYTYDAQNNVVQAQNGSQKTTRYEYDSKGNVTKETDVLGNSTIYTYNPVNNKVASRRDKNGNTTAYQYDTHGHVIQVNKPLGVIEKFTYDEKGNQLSFTDGNNNTTTYQYDGAGNLIKVTDPENHSLEYAYDCRGNKLSEKDARGNATSYEYNALNQLVKTTDALGGTITYAYDRSGNVKTVTNQLGKVTTYEYDGLNRLVKTISPSGITNATVYDEQHNVTKRIDGNGNAVSYTYNSRKQVLTQTDALGNMVSLDYDEAGNLVSEKDSRGGVTRYEYDDNGRLLKRTDALGGVIQYSYDAMGNRVAQTDANGNMTTYAYDALQRVSKITDALGKSVSYTYDANGNRLTEKDKNGNTTVYTYDKLNRVKTITDALGAITSYTYDANGNTVTETNPLNLATTRTYDALNRPLTMSNPLNEVIAYTYDAAGNNKTTTQPNGNVIASEYNDDGRLIASTDVVGPIVSYSYDGNGNMLTETDGNNNTVSYSYDAANRRTTVTDAMGNSSFTVYDAGGNVIREANRNGNSQTYSYDALNRRISETSALGHTTRFAYDANGNRLSIVDAKNNITSYSYDALNRLLKETYADGSTRQFTYDGNGNPKTRKDNNGVVSNYTYDALGRMVQRSYPGSISDSYSYDLAGRRVSANNANAAITLTYDNANRKLTEVLNGKATVLAYNTGGRIKTITYPGNKSVIEERDERDRLIAVKEGGATLATFDYDAGNRLIKKTFGNGFYQNYTYNANDWLVTLTCQPGDVVNFNFNYDKEGNRITALKKHRQTHSEKYIYDNAYRLIGFYLGNISGDALSDTVSKNYYAYDALNNRITSVEDSVIKIYDVNQVNAYVAITVNGITITPTINSNGNITSREDKTYTYDNENRLLLVKDGEVAKHFYDAFGRRVKSITVFDTVEYFFNDNQIVEERNGNNAVLKNYIYGTWMDDVISYTYQNIVFYLANSLQGNSLVALNAVGPIEKYEYSVLGEMRFYNENYVRKLNSSVNNNIGFTGRPYQDYQNLYDFRARVYNHVEGRFNQRDPLGYIDGFNLYNGYFVPFNTDPLGTYTLTEAAKDYCKKVVGCKTKNGCDVCELMYDPTFIMSVNIDINLSRTRAQLLYDYWYNYELNHLNTWINDLQRQEFKCPCRINVNCNSQNFEKAGLLEEYINEIREFHPGAKYMFRSKKSINNHGQQCNYGENNNGYIYLIGNEDPLAAGSADYYSPINKSLHWEHDVNPFVIARWLDNDGFGKNLRKYLKVRPVNGGASCRNYE